MEEKNEKQINTESGMRRILMLLLSAGVFSGITVFIINKMFSFLSYQYNMGILEYWRISEVYVRDYSKHYFCYFV